MPNRAFQTRVSLFFAVVFSVTLALRLCHSGLLWPDEDYHLAAAIHLLHGKMLYRDLWYDKPPLSALVYALIGAPTGWGLRLFDAAWITGICGVAFHFALDMWGEAEGLIAAGLIAFFLNFDLPGGVIPIAPDFFMVLPHLLAVWCAWKGRPFAAGGWCGIAFLFNPKGLFVLVACGLLEWQSLPLLLAGFAIPNAVTLGTLFAQGAAGPYFEQVWKWGLTYAKVPPAASTVGDGVRRTVNWLGFHGALVLGCAWFWWKERGRGARFLAVWGIVSLVAVASGSRFSSRYFLQLLPVMAFAPARGMAGRRRVMIAVCGVLLAVPLVRFGPRYFLLATSRSETWGDTALDRDSRVVSDWLAAHRQPSDSLFVWGYRPDVFAFTRMLSPSRFWDSQPLTGVPADRHLTESRSLIPGWAAANRRELTESRPAFVVDGLSRLNPQLGVDRFPELRAWVNGYEPVKTTDLSVIYRRAVIIAMPDGK